MFMNQPYNVKERNQAGTTRPVFHKTAMTGIYYISVLSVFMNQIVDQPVIISLTSLLDMSDP